MTNFSDMLSKAKAMQEKMKEAKIKLKKLKPRVKLVEIWLKSVLSGDYELKSIIN